MSLPGNRSLNLIRTHKTKNRLHKSATRDKKTKIRIIRAQNTN
ncbi:hypothetical protein FLA_3209 [Filimonas lacunae]|nr:hypothetical protein FLA_3209 [Filimonas lacunae]